MKKYLFVIMWTMNTIYTLCNYYYIPLFERQHRFHFLHRNFPRLPPPPLRSCIYCLLLFYAIFSCGSNHNFSFSHWQINRFVANERKANCKNRFSIIKPNWTFITHTNRHIIHNIVCVTISLLFVNWPIG